MKNIGPFYPTSDVDSSGIKKGARLKPLEVIMSLRNMMRIVFVVIALSILLSSFFVFQLNGLSAEVEQMAEVRYRSYQAADELRQSSDDLTRLGRTYVITADDKYEKMYMDILDIRNGKKPRPENYHTIYWDLVLEHGQKPKPDQDIVALKSIMQQLGFTDGEFALLSEAQANSDGLVAMEVKAMNAVKGLYPDSQGNYTIKAEPDMAMARELLHSNQYHIEKAKIMAPIDKFFTQLEQRTNQQLISAVNAVHQIVIVSNILLLVVLMAAFAGYLIVTKKITRPIRRMSSQLQKADQNSDLTIRIDRIQSNELGQIAKGINNLLASYSKTIANVKESNDSIQAVAKTIQDVTQNNIDQSQRQVSELEMAATAMEQMTAALANVAENTNQAESYAAETETEANSGQSIIERSSSDFSVLQHEFDDTSEVISQLAEESNNVGNVLDVIKAIAEQTNLLALNAAIEAARAGEQGRGFAVVADEVRSLAQRTQESTVEIEAMIASLQEKAKKSMSTIQHSADKMNSTSESIANASQALLSIKTSASQIHELNTMIASATEEQFSVSNEISSNIQNVKGISNTISEKINELGPIVVQMSSNVEKLNKSVSHLTI